MIFLRRISQIVRMSSLVQLSRSHWFSLEQPHFLKSASLLHGSSTFIVEVNPRDNFTQIEEIFNTRVFRLLRWMFLITFLSHDQRECETQVSTVRALHFMAGFVFINCSFNCIFKKNKFLTTRVVNFLNPFFKEMATGISEFVRINKAVGDFFKFIV